MTSVSAAMLASSLVFPATSYLNTGGQGDRTSIITVTSNITWDSGTNNNLVDGATANNSTDSVDEPGIGSTAIADGDWVRFDFGTDKYVDEVTLTVGNAGDAGSWKIRGTGDTVSFFDLATFTWSTNPDQVVPLITNLNFYRYLELTKNGAGTNWPNRWFNEVKFKIG